jgi:hypothetical protein
MHDNAVELVGEDMPENRRDMILFGCAYKKAGGIVSATRPSDKFALLQEFIQSYLEQLGGVQSEEKTAQNTLTIVVVELLDGLIRFGFVATLEEFYKVVGPLVQTLDGHNDQVGSLNEKRHHASTAGARLVSDIKRKISEFDRSRFASFAQRT